MRYESRQRNLGVLVLGLCLSISCSTADKEQGVDAHETRSAIAQIEQLTFDDGIGFYWAADGIAHYLYWPTAPTSRAPDSSIIDVPTYARFFSYGLDFSGANGSLTRSFTVAPPHLTGYSFHYRTVDGTRKPSGTSAWPVRFLPVNGYTEKVYEIIFDGPIERMRNGDLQHRYFALELPSDQAYLLRFDSAAYDEEREEQMARLSKALSNSDRLFLGEITVQTMLFNPDVQEFKVRFLRFDRESGEIVAEVLRDSRTTRMEGAVLNPYRIELRDDESEVRWELQYAGNGVYVAQYSKQHLSVVTVTIDLSVNDSADEQS